MELDHRHSCPAKLGFAALAFSSLLAVYRSGGDSGTAAFVAGADGALALLFHFLRRLERGERGRNAKAAVWLLTTLLTAMFASRVAPLMPPVVASVVWLMAAGTVGTGFWAMFLNP
ncbi:unnamed protein product [Urochloa decumbens]|uniref:Uncharacterized protein n=1 Tax=Urochloa decumbens TaxID=240449 RepID=A0ABC9DDH9_9POAL